jgi:hypothetical protein
VAYLSLVSAAAPRCRSAGNYNHYISVEYYYKRSAAAHALLHRPCLSKQHHTEPVASTAYQSSLSPSSAKKSSSSVAAGGDGASTFPASGLAQTTEQARRMSCRCDAGVMQEQHGPGVQCVDRNTSCLAYADCAPPYRQPIPARSSGMKIAESRDRAPSLASSPERILSPKP